MAILSPVLRQRFFDSNGRPLAGGKLYSYAAGTTTPAATYADQSGTPNTNPVVLDANGEADIWIAFGAYKFILHDANDVQQWVVDHVMGSQDAEGGGDAIGDLSGTYPGPEVVGIYGNAITEPGSSQNGMSPVYNHSEGIIEWVLKADASDLQPLVIATNSHINNTNNPHDVTKEQLDLGNVTNDAQLKIASNLSDLADVPTARTNLGLGDAALEDKGDAVFNAGKIQGVDVDDQSPTTGQSIVYDGEKWTFGSPEAEVTVNQLYPVGSQYTQYPTVNHNTVGTALPASESPAALYGGTWELLQAESNTTNGAMFFRTEGGNSDETGARSNGRQTDQIQRIVGVAGASHFTRRAEFADTQQSGAFSWLSGGVSRNATDANSHEPTLRLNLDTNLSSSAVRSSSGTSGETRAKNRLFRIWRRIA